MQIPTGVIGIIILLSSIFITNRIKIRFILIAIIIIPAIGGAIGLLYVPRKHTRGLMGCFYTMYFYQALREPYSVSDWARHLMEPFDVQSRSCTHGPTSTRPELRNASSPPLPYSSVVSQSRHQ